MTTQRITYINSEGGVSVIVPSTTIEACIKDIPEGVAYDIIEGSDLPVRAFRNAWRKTGSVVATDIPEAKLLAHDRRRSKRAEAFAPLDTEATIPSMAVAAEASRQVIRDADALVQAAIDACTDEAELLAILSAESL